MSPARNFPKILSAPSAIQSFGLSNRWATSSGWRFPARAATELQNGDWTLAIVLGAMAVECELAYLFMKWSRIDLMSVRMPSSNDEKAWENQWQNNVRSISARLDKVSGLLTGQPFDSFLAQKTGLLHPVHARYPASKNAVSPKQFFIKELFHKRNRIVHFGEIDFQRADAEMGVTLAAALSQILAAMDAERRRTMEAKHSVQLRAPS